MAEQLDVLVIGSGISGISAAWHLQTQCPHLRYAVLEARERMGGTWDLFRYPGIRSDSDMYTLGFSFRPWTDAKAIADGPSILRYVEDTATENGIDRHIRYGIKVRSASWSTVDAAWDVVAERDGEEVAYRCNFLVLCTGYYNYSRGYLPEWPGMAEFKGVLAQPQFWTDDIDVTGKRVVVIGSGATAVTLVPELAKQAASVVMLQRSPTYIVSQPSQDVIANWLRRMLPSKAAYALTRWKNVLVQQYFYGLARKHPEKAKQRIVEMVQGELGPDYDVGTHFTPSYNPWDQRLCLVPDSDLFATIREGKAEVVTDTIERFTETGLQLASGRKLEADVVVPATGLEMRLLGDIALSVDGEPVELPQHTSYKGMMLSDVPNMALSFGYTNASWTLKADLTSAYVCRLLKTMQRRGMRQATPRMAGQVEALPFLDFTSGYVQRAAAGFPRQGMRKPWRLKQNYTHDLMTLRYGSVDQEMEFSNPVAGKKAA